MIYAASAGLSMVWLRCIDSRQLQRNPHMGVPCNRFFDKVPIVKATMPGQPRHSSRA
jgi:hypothetical protein